LGRGELCSFLSIIHCISAFELFGICKKTGLRPGENQKEIIETP